MFALMYIHKGFVQIHNAQKVSLILNFQKISITHKTKLFQKQNQQKMQNMYSENDFHLLSKPVVL